MAKIEYEDKDNQLPTSNPRRLWRDDDANEVKEVVNTNADSMGFKAVPFEPGTTPETAAFPETGGSGDGGVVMDGNRFKIAIEGYFPGTDGPELWPPKTIAEALVDNPGADPDNWKLY
jgi:hypothetical protein